MIWLLALWIGGAPAETPRERVTRAYAAHDYAGFLSAAQEWTAQPWAPPVAVYDLACAFAVNGRATEAIAALDRLADAGLSFAPQDDGDFANLKSSAELQRVVARFAANRAPIVASQVAFTLADRDITESVAFDPQTHTSFVSRVRQRKIVRITGDTQRDFVTAAQDGLWSPLGMQVDVTRRRLWVAEVAVPQSAGYTPADKNRTGLIAFDLTNGRPVAHFTLPNDAPHALGDVIVASDGTVYATDSLTPTVYRVGKTLEPFIATGLSSLQGLTLSSDERTLYVADDTKGVFAITLATRQLRQLNAVVGIDGLYRSGATLIGVINGQAPHRVVAMPLDAPTVVKVLERAAPQYDEPTLGVLHDGALYYVANSQWSQGAKAAPAVSATILRLPLQP